MNILEIQNLDVFYDRKKVLEKINLSVPEKKIVSIIGESGSGKTTLFKTILGIAPKSARLKFQGNIFFKNQKCKIGKERKILPVFQDPSLYFHRGWTLEECLLEPVEILRLDKTKKDKEIYNLLEIFSINYSFLNKKIETFSGGELQRISIIRTILAEPELILMDEPVSGLDRIVLAETVRFIQDLQKKYEISILVISHDLDFVSEISEFMYIMHNGKIAESGRTQEIISNPKADYTKELFSARDLSGIYVRN